MLATLVVLSVLTVNCICIGPQPGFVTRGDARGHGPGRANGLYVVVVGEGECRPFLRGRSEQPSIPSESASTGGYEKVGLHHKWITVGLHS